MATTTIAGREYEVNEEGFLTDPSVWTEELGAELARLIGIEMTDAALEGDPLPARRLRA